MESKKKQVKPETKVHIGLFAGVLFLWLITFWADSKIFTNDPLNMNSLPIDPNAVLFMHIASKLLALFVIWGMLLFFSYGLKHKKLLAAFIGFFLLYIILLLCDYPGYYMGDDTIIFGYATRYYPVYWHNYLTSLYFMVGMTLFPASTGPILLQDLCLALTFSYIVYQTDRLFTVKARYLVILCGLMPFVLLSALMCFRPALYSPFLLFFLAFLIFERKGKKELTLGKMLFLSALSALLCFWRSEGIVLFFFCFLLIPVCYGIKWKKMVVFCIAFVIFFLGIRVPQVAGEKKYYGSDYLIVSTIRPLSLIIQREQTYPEAEEDLNNIDAIVSLSYISYETLSCSSYNRYNSDYNRGRFTETGADKETQRAYLKSALRLILKNPDLYFAERLQLFLTTNGIYNYDKALVMGLEPVTTAEFHLYQSDRDYGFTLIDGNKRLPVNGGEDLALFLFRYGGEAYLPVLILLLLTCICTLIKKKWLIFWMGLSLFAREAVIFLTAPAAFVQYSYPSMFAAVFLFMITIIEIIEDKKTALEITLKEKGKEA